MALTFRETEWQQMYCCLDVVPGESLPHSMFVTGPPGCGKNLLVSSVLDTLVATNKISTFCQVSCIPASINVREIYQAILRDLRKNLTGSCSEDEIAATNFADLVSRLNEILTPDMSAVIALSSAEILRNLDPLLLPGLLRLAEVSQLNVCVIFVSRIPWSRWQIIQWATTQPITINLAQYNKKQLTELLVRSLRSLPYPDKLDESPDFFRNFADIILGMFYVVCRSLSQFLRVAQLLFPVYIAPVIEGNVEPNNARFLMRLAEPHIKQCLAQIHLREDGLTYQPKVAADPAKALELVNGPPKPSRLSVELPFYSKFLLISAFLASYNPAKSDKRFFVQNCGRIKKRKNPVAISSHKRSSQLLGPKPFPLDRMLAIFYVIVDHKVPPRSKILNQVSSLVSLHLLTQTGSSDLDWIETPKYKCNVSLDFIKLVSQNVKFEVHKYLYDANL